MPRVILKTALKYAERNLIKQARARRWQDIPKAALDAARQLGIVEEEASRSRSTSDQRESSSGTGSQDPAPGGNAETTGGGENATAGPRDPATG